MEVQRRETTTPTLLLLGSDAREWAVTGLGSNADVEVPPDPSAPWEQVPLDVIDCAVVAPAGSDASADGGVTADAAAASGATDPADAEATTALADHDDALDAIAALRERDPALPIVYAPAEADGVAASEATSAGASAYLPRELAGGAPDGTDVGPHSDRVEGLRECVDRLVAEYDRRRQAEMEQEMLRELLGSAPLSIYFKDRDARHVAITSHTTTAFDQTFVGKTDRELYAEEIGEELARESLEDDLEVIATGEPNVDREERHVTPEGEEIWLRTTKFPWRDEDGEIVGVIGITRDVTEVKRRERELEAEKRRLEQFASFASHDLRNPVSIAQGYLEQARSGAGDVEEAHEVVAESLDRMDRLIDDLLNMVRPEDEREIDGWADLADVAERAWEVAGDDAATLDLALPDRTEIQAAEGGLRQLLENVFSNSIDHGGDAPTVEVGFTDTGFYVADDGPGIPEADRDQVFDYGYTTGGTGVGLAITNEIAEAHGWTPTAAESEAGGAKFVFDGVIRRPPPVEEVAPAEPVALDGTTDVDGATPPGEAVEDSTGAWTLHGGGENLWGDLETFFALHGSATGDCRIEARLTGVEAVHEFSKAGVLVADAVESGAPLAFAGVTASHGAETAIRSEPGAMVDTAQFDAVEGVPAYVRIDRVGDRCTAWVSVDGEDWTPIDQTVLPLAETAAVGLAVCSHNPDRRCEATFEAVRVVGLDADDGTA